MSHYEDTLLGKDDTSSEGAFGSSGTTTETPIEAGDRRMHPLKTLVFDLIRPLFVKNIKPNEEFLCETCRGPILRRVVFCSSKCHNIHTDKWIARFKRHQ